MFFQISNSFIIILLKPHIFLVYTERIQFCQVRKWFQEYACLDCTISGTPFKILINEQVKHQQKHLPIQ